MTRHPGDILKREYLEPLGLSPSELASGLGVHRSTIKRLLDGHVRLTPEMSALLGAYFRVPARWWLQLQLDYDAQQIAACPEWSSAVTPWEGDAEVMLTPKGVVRLPREEHQHKNEPISIPAKELSALSQVSKPVSRRREVAQVAYPSGAAALVGELP